MIDRPFASAGRGRRAGRACELSLEELDRGLDRRRGDQMPGVRQDRELAVLEHPVGRDALLDRAEIVSVSGQDQCGLEILRRSSNV